MVRRLALLVGAVLAGTFLLAAPATAWTNEDSYTPTLPSGHCLVTTRNDPGPRLRSHSKRFDLTVFNGGQLNLDNFVAVPGGGGDGSPTWYYAARHPSRSASLCMQRNGDLVFRTDGSRAWHTGTSVAGSFARLTDGGRLVVRTPAGRVLWSTRTTAVLMIVGDRLTSGRTLVNRIAPGRITYLRMLGTGDLTLYAGRQRVWHSNTHVRGSYAYITVHGRLAVATPGHRILWRSAGEGPRTVLTVRQHGRLVLARPYNRCVVLPQGANPDCGTD